MNKILKFNEAIKKAAGKIISGKIEMPGVLVTVTRVKTTADLKKSTVFISVLGASSKQVLDEIKKQVFDIQKDLNESLKRSRAPRLFFAEEKDLENSIRLEELLEKASKKC